jgi:hypothetical protein
MCEPWHLTTLWASAACYSDSFTLMRMADSIWASSSLFRNCTNYAVFKKLVWVGKIMDKSGRIQLVHAPWTSACRERATNSQTLSPSSQIVPSVGPHRFVNRTRIKPDICSPSEWAAHYDAYLTVQWTSKQRKNSDITQTHTNKIKQLLVYVRLIKIITP